MEVKKFYLSKTLWVNIIAVGVGVALDQFGIVIAPQYQVMALGAINWVLRFVTKTEIAW